MAVRYSGDLQISFEQRTKEALLAKKAWRDALDAGSATAEVGGFPISTMFANILADNQLRILEADIMDDISARPDAPIAYNDIKVMAKRELQDMILKITEAEPELKLLQRLR